LSLAGRVFVEDVDGKIQHRLIHIKKPILRIPTLAIHLDRSVKGTFAFNEEVQLTPILAEAVENELNKLNGSENTMHHPELLDMFAKELNINGNCMFN
jgi:aspartyl aminopeptidase